MKSLALDVIVEHFTVYLNSEVTLIQVSPYKKRLWSKKFQILDFHIRQSFTIPGNRKK